MGGLFRGDVLLDGAVAPVDRHLHLAAERQAGPQIRGRDVETQHQRIEVEARLRDGDRLFGHVGLAVTRREGDRRRTRRGFGVALGDEFETRFGAGHREPVAPFGAGIGPVIVCFDGDLPGLGGGGGEGYGLHRRGDRGGALLHDADRLRGGRGALLARDELEGDFAVLGRFVGIERKENLSPGTFDEHPRAGFGLEDPVFIGGLHVERGRELPTGGNLEVVLRCDDLEGAVGILRNADRGALVAGGDRYGALQLGLLEVVFTAQDELIGPGILLQGEPLGIGGSLPGGVGLDVDDDFAAETLELNGCVERVLGLEPRVVRADAEFGVDGRGSLARNGVGVDDRILGTSRQREQKAGKNIEFSHWGKLFNGS